MLITSITGVVEPVSFSMNSSLSWKLTEALKAKQEYAVVNQDSVPIATLVGIVPLLQPINTTVDGSPAFLVMLRMFFDVADAATLVPGSPYRLQDMSAELVASFVAASAPALHKSAHIMEALLAPPNLGLTSDNLAGLEAYVVMLRYLLWPAEPINWTTTNMHLASTGNFMSASEMTTLGVTGGILNVANGAYEVGSGTTPMVIRYRPSWNKAGRVTSIIPGFASSSGCTSADGATTPTSAGGGVGGTGSGGDPTSDSIT